MQPDYNGSFLLNNELLITPIKARIIKMFQCTSKFKLNLGLKIFIFNHFEKIKV